MMPGNKPETLSMKADALLFVDKRPFVPHLTSHPLDVPEVCLMRVLGNPALTSNLELTSSSLPNKKPISHSLRLLETQEGPVLGAAEPDAKHLGGDTQRGAICSCGHSVHWPSIGHLQAQGTIWPNWSNFPVLFRGQLVGAGSTIFCETKYFLSIKQA